MRHYGTLGYRIIVQSNTHAPDHLDERIESFLISARVCKETGARFTHTKNGADNNSAETNT